MLNILSRIKERRNLKKELELTTLRYRMALNASDTYSGWVFAYKNAIWELCKAGDISEEVSEKLYKKAEGYYEYFKNH